MAQRQHAQLQGGVQLCASVHSELGLPLHDNIPSSQSSLMVAHHSLVVLSYSFPPCFPIDQNSSADLLPVFSLLMQAVGSARRDGIAMFRNSLKMLLTGGKSNRKNRSSGK